MCEPYICVLIMAQRNDNTSDKTSYKGSGTPANWLKHRKTYFKSFLKNSFDEEAFSWSTGLRRI